MKSVTKPTSFEVSYMKIDIMYSSQMHVFKAGIYHRNADAGESEGRFGSIRNKNCILLSN